MAGENKTLIYLPDMIGLDIYVRILNIDDLDQIYNSGTTAFEDYQSGNQDQYGLLMTESLVPGWFYVANPAALSAAKSYPIEIWKLIGLEYDPDADYFIGTNEIGPSLGSACVDTKTPIEALRIIGASAAGESSNAGESQEHYRGLDGSTERLTVNYDVNENRTTVAYP